MGPRAAGFLIFRVYEEKLQYLLLRASYGIKHWTPPKGHVDPGESDWETALRETKEEAGLLESDLNIYQNIKKVSEYPVNGKKKTVIYWLAQLKNPLKEIKLSDEHIDFTWLPYPEAVLLAAFDEFTKLLSELHIEALKISNIKE